MSSGLSRHDLEVEDLGDVTVVRFQTRRLHDDAQIQAVFGQVAGLVDQGRARLVLNFRKVEFLASVAIGKLVVLSRKVQAARGRLVLCHLGPATDEALEVMHLKEIVPTYDTEAEALQSF